VPSPAKVNYATQAEYRQHFERLYCNGVVLTFDGIAVRFRKEDFDHCMYESSNRDGVKDQFSKERSERIDWIKATLESPEAELYQGWDGKRKCYLADRRVSVVYEEFVVIIQLLGPPQGQRRARFITAYLADNNFERIKRGPKWV
jgi:hypothetical protein